MTTEDPGDPGVSESPASEVPAPSDTGSDTRTDTGRARRLTVWQESGLLLVVAVGLAIVLKAFFVQAFYIPSASMEPGLQPNDRILVEKPSYWFGNGPSRGDVVVFSDPGGWLPPDEDDQASGVEGVLAKVGLYPSGGHLVKRVIGVGGDTVACCDDRGRVEVNGDALDEAAYLPGGGSGLPCDAPMRGCQHWSVTVPPHNLFVMGDNRDDSADSTVHLCLAQQTDCTDNPFVPTDLVVGKVFAIVWPRSRWDWITRPDDFAAIPAPAS